MPGPLMPSPHDEVARTPATDACVQDDDRVIRPPRATLRPFVRALWVSDRLDAPAEPGARARHPDR